MESETQDGAAGCLSSLCLQVNRPLTELLGTVSDSLPTRLEVTSTCPWLGTLGVFVVKACKGCTQPSVDTGSACSADLCAPVTGPWTPAPCPLLHRRGCSPFTFPCACLLCREDSGVWLSSRLTRKHKVLASKCSLRVGHGGAGRMALHHLQPVKRQDQARLPGSGQMRAAVGSAEPLLRSSPTRLAVSTVLGCHHLNSL